MHWPVVLHLNQLRRGINVMFISEWFCNPLLHFKMTKDDEMPKVEEMAAVTLTNILWETCRNILGLHWQIHHGSVWQPDQYDQVIKHGAGAEDIRVNPLRMRKSILKKRTCSIFHSLKYAKHEIAHQISVGESHNLRSSHLPPPHKVGFVVIVPQRLPLQDVSARKSHFEVFFPLRLSRNCNGLTLDGKLQPVTLKILPQATN